MTTLLWCVSADMEMAAEAKKQASTAVSSYYVLIKCNTSKSPKRKYTRKND